MEKACCHVSLHHATVLRKLHNALVEVESKRIPTCHLIVPTLLQMHTTVSSWYARGYLSAVLTPRSPIASSVATIIAAKAVAHWTAIMFSQAAPPCLAAFTGSYVLTWVCAWVCMLTCNNLACVWPLVMILSTAHDSTAAQLVQPLSDDLWPAIV